MREDVQLLPQGSVSDRLYQQEISLSEDSTLPADAVLLDLDSQSIRMRSGRQGSPSHSHFVIIGTNESN